MDNERCPHNSKAVAQETVPGHYFAIRFPMYRCALAELMIERLQSHPQGSWIADALQTTAADNTTRPHIGPDLIPLHPLTCTGERCGRCASHFIEHLTTYGQDASLPEQLPTEHRSRRRAGAEDIYARPRFNHFRA